MVENIVKRCCVCKSIKLNNKIIPRGAPGNMGNENHNYSDGLFSISCVEKFYGDEMAKDMIKAGVLGLERCPTLDEYIG